MKANERTITRLYQCDMCNTIHGNRYYTIKGEGINFKAESKQVWEKQVKLLLTPFIDGNWSDFTISITANGKTRETENRSLNPR